jgi:hypothetical protein
VAVVAAAGRRVAGAWLTAWSCSCRCTMVVMIDSGERAGRRAELIGRLELLPTAAAVASGSSTTDTAGAGAGAVAAAVELTLGRCCGSCCGCGMVETVMAIIGMEAAAVAAGAGAAVVAVTAGAVATGARVEGTVSWRSGLVGMTGEKAEEAGDTSRR